MLSSLTTVYVPSSETGPPQHLSRKRVCPPPGVKGGGGAHSPAAKGVGEFQFRRLEKGLALCLLCGSLCTLSPAYVCLWRGGGRGNKVANKISTFSSQSDQLNFLPDFPPVFPEPCGGGGGGGGKWGWRWKKYCGTVVLIHVGLWNPFFTSLQMPNSWT
jgi:hypothetical protein